MPVPVTSDSTGRSNVAPPGSPLAIEGTLNLRDLGGYATAKGDRTRVGVVYRADSLAYLTDAGLAELQAMGLRLVCDLRRPEEVERLPNRLPDGVRYDHNPMIMNVNVMADYRLPDFDWSTFQLETLYIRMLEHSGQTFRRVFEHLAQYDSYPFLFHCAAGKDRTGMTAALLLRVAGVPDDTIAADFALSETHIGPRVPEFLDKLRERSGNVEGAERLFGSPAKAMHATLAHLDERYGSTLGYLAAIGVPPAEIDAFRDAFIEVRPEEP